MRTKKIVSNPLANATGKQLGERTTLVLDTKNIPITTLQRLAKPTKVELKLQKVVMPVLPLMEAIGYSPKNSYYDFGKYVAGKAKKGSFSSECKSLANRELQKAKVKSRVFVYNNNSAWRVFSRDYYPQKIENLYKNINDYFELQFRAKVQDIAETQDKAKKTQKEQELKKYLTESLLREQIGTIITEAQENKEAVIKCIESFVLNPQIVLNHQFVYYNERYRQENPDTAAEVKRGIKAVTNRLTSGGARDGSINATNETFTATQNMNRETYNAALAKLPVNSYLQIVNDNIDAAFKYIDSFDSTEVSNGQTQLYTRTLGRFNTSPRAGSSGFKKKSDLGILLAGGGVLAAIYMLKNGDFL